MKLRRLFLVAAAALALAGPAIAQTGPTLQKVSQESVIEQIKLRGKLRVAQGVFVPWAMPSKEGKLIGFEIDVAKISVPELSFQGSQVAGATRGMFEAWFSVGAIYFVICFSLSMLFARLEKRGHRRGPRLV